jgi:hypothetical protein
MRLSVLALLLLSSALVIGPVWASQAEEPAAQTGKMDKKAISKSCTDQANAKGLHGKARKKFRSECKHNGGKAE